MSTLEERIDDYLVRQVEKYLELRTALEAQAAEWTAKANQFAESGGDFGGAYHLRQAAANITKLLEGK